MSTNITGGTYSKGKVTVSAGDYGYSRRLIGDQSICCGPRGYTSLGGRQACQDSLRNENHGCGQACKRIEVEDNVWRPQYAQFPLDTSAFQNGGASVSHSIQKINPEIDSGYKRSSNNYSNMGVSSKGKYATLGAQKQAPAPQAPIQQAPIQQAPIQQAPAPQAPIQQ